MSTDDLLNVDPTTVEDCVNAVSAFARGQGPAPGDHLGVRWSAQSQEDNVQLASLAPDAMNDMAEWDPTRCGPLVRWLEALRDGTNWKIQKWKRLIEGRDAYDGDKKVEIVKQLTKSAAERDGFRVLMMVMVWCELHCCQQSGLIDSASAQDVLTVLSMEANQGQRPLRRFFDDNATLATFFDTLRERDRWPYGALGWVVPAVQSYMRAISSPKPGTAPWVGPQGLRRLGVDYGDESLLSQTFDKARWPRVIRD